MANRIGTEYTTRRQPRVTSERGSAGQSSPSLGTGSFTSSSPIISGVSDVVAGLGIPFISDIAEMFGKASDKQFAIDMYNADKQFNASQAKINRNFQQDERLATQEFMLDMWNKSNDYNSPLQQVERLVRAGINPNSVFSGSNSIATSQPVKSTPMPGSQASAPSGSLASSLLTSDATIRNLLASANKTDKDAEKVDDERKHLQAQVDDIASQIGLRGKESELLDITLKYAADKSELELKAIAEEVNKLRNENLNLLKDLYVKDGEIRLQGKKIDLMEMQILGEQQQIYESQHRISNLNQEGELLQEQTEGQMFDNKVKKLLVDFSTVTGVPLGTPEYMLNFYLMKQGDWWNYYNNLSTRGLQSLVEAPGKLLGGLRLSNTDYSKKFNYPSYGRSYQPPGIILNRHY